MAIKPEAEWKVGSLKVKVYSSAVAMGAAAAEAAARSLRALAATNKIVSVIFATGQSQLETLHALTAMKDIPWSQVVAFHMDEYLSLSDTHPASLRSYLRKHLADRVPLHHFYAIDGTAAKVQQTVREYTELMRSHKPQLCLMGIGESGHVAFNDPAVANFHDPEDMKVVMPDDTSRQQQVSEGAFRSLSDFPQQALTLTIPALFRVPELILSVPGPRKGQIVKRTLEEPISTACPATILRTHPNATLYLDKESSAQLKLQP